MGWSRLASASLMLFTALFSQLSLAGWWEDFRDAPRKAGVAIGDVYSGGETSRQRDRDHEEGEAEKKKAERDAAAREKQAKKDGLVRTIAEQQLNIEGWQRVKAQLPAIMPYHDMLMNMAVEKLPIVEKIEQDARALKALQEEQLPSFCRQEREAHWGDVRVERDSDIDEGGVFSRHKELAERSRREACRPKVDMISIVSDYRGVELLDFTHKLSGRIDAIEWSGGTPVEQAEAFSGIWSETLAEYEGVFGDGAQNYINSIINHASVLSLKKFIEVLGQLEARMDYLAYSIEEELKKAMERKAATEAELAALG